MRRSGSDARRISESQQLTRASTPLTSAGREAGACHVAMYLRSSCHEVRNFVRFRNGVRCKRANVTGGSLAASTLTRFERFEAVRISWATHGTGESRTGPARCAQEKDDKPESHEPPQHRRLDRE